MIEDENLQRVRGAGGLAVPHPDVVGPGARVRNREHTRSAWDAGPLAAFELPSLLRNPQLFPQTFESRTLGIASESAAATI
jgi:hypothetical protein